MMKHKMTDYLLISSLVLIAALSLLRPYSYFTWILEAAPVIIAVPLLIITRKRFTFVRMTYILLWAHAIVLLIGAHYTYERNPLFQWIQEEFMLKRNHYDRLGHFFQGFVPAMVVRELLIRTSPLKKGKWLFFIVLSICVSVSAYYEFIEWWVSELMGKSADDFLGSQGDIWDAQWDMFLAFLGAFASLIFLGRLHDRCLSKLDPGNKQTPAVTLTV